MFGHYHHQLLPKLPKNFHHATVRNLCSFLKRSPSKSAWLCFSVYACCFTADGRTPGRGDSKESRQLSTLKVLWEGLMDPTSEVYSIYTYIWANQESLWC